MLESTAILSDSTSGTARLSEDSAPSEVDDRLLEVVTGAELGRAEVDVDLAGSEAPHRATPGSEGGTILHLESLKVNTVRPK